MAHMIEMRDGKAQMAWAGQTPWHGLGTKVPDDLTPEQMLEAAGLDWTVEKIPAYAEVNGKRVDVGHSALVRSVDSKVLDVVSNDWNPYQNSDAFDFFNDFIAAGDMSMHTAGSLKGGQIVWALAKVNDGFSLFNGDNVESYLLFTNPHQYGKSIDVRFTPIRVVCNNTLTLSLNTQTEHLVRVSHRREFVPDTVKEMLGIAKDKLSTYKEMAAFLGSKRYTNENIVEYFTRVFPMTTKTEEKKLSRNANMALEIIDQQPGAEYAAGTFWSAFNTVSFMTDHVLGRSTDTRLQSSWFGYNKTLKNNALELAVEMANAA